ncbi:unnamed protein product [Paramecium primaurelia]|uniref:Tetratricopeptide repeat protein n=1 Tax=Paramecium primaurelia TaxID=5886 RepID=A0A8S1PPJ2_PARPR|nr:unnamed protein product [Paramecium primaurelia]
MEAIINNYHIGLIYYILLQYDRVVEEYLKAISFDPYHVYRITIEVNILTIEQLLPFIIQRIMMRLQKVSHMQFRLTQIMQQHISIEKILIQNQIQLMQLYRIQIRQLRFTQNQLFQKIYSIHYIIVQKKLLRTIIYTLRYQDIFRRPLNKIHNMARLITTKLKIDVLSTGFVQQHLKYYEDAIKNFSDAIKIDPKLAAVYNKRGNVYNLLKKYPEAIQDYSSAIEIDPQYAKAYNNRYRIDDCYKDYELANKIDPEYKNIKWNLQQNLSIFDMPKQFDCEFYYYQQKNKFRKIQMQLGQTLKQQQPINQKVNINNLSQGLTYFMLKYYEKALNNIDIKLQLNHKRLKYSSKKVYIYLLQLGCVLILRYQKRNNLII